jgi:hypothetical protein
MIAVITASVVATACGDDASSQASQEQQQGLTQQEPHPILATTFNAVPTQSASSTDTSLQLPQSASSSSTTLHAPQSSSAQAQPPASPGGASEADSVVLAPPVIHTVD